jgi:hypothetical protein
MGRMTIMLGTRVFDVAGLMARRPHVTGGVVLAAGLVVGVALAYSAMEFVSLVRPASTVFISQTQADCPQRCG